MLHSTYYLKETNEDSKTSAIFENLMLLPDNVFWHLLRQSSFSHETMPKLSGELLSYDFWPHWDKTGTDNKKYVEPDLFLRFESFDVIIEAKYGDYKGQYHHQWQQEITAYHNEYGYDKQFVFIAIGGNQSNVAETISVKSQKVKIYKCNWLSILMNINKYKKELEHLSTSIPDMNFSATLRLLRNIILAFNINGVYNIDWFNSMSQPKPIISETSIDNFNKHYNW